MEISCPITGRTRRPKSFNQRRRFESQTLNKEAVPIYSRVRGCTATVDGWMLVLESRSIIFKFRHGRKNRNFSRNLVILSSTSFLS